MKRGKESKEHLSAKQLVGELFSTTHTVFYEPLDCDVLVICEKNNTIVGIEVERRSKNVLRNLTKDFNNGAQAIAVFSLKDKITRNICKQAYQFDSCPIAVFSKHQISELHQWVLSHLNHNRNHGTT